MFAKAVIRGQPFSITTALHVRFRTVFYVIQQTHAKPVKAERHSSGTLVSLVRLRDALCATQRIHVKLAKQGQLCSTMPVSRALFQTAIYALLQMSAKPVN
jgi:hypothetical protein